MFYTFYKFFLLLLLWYIYIHIYCARICKWILFFSVCSHSYSPRIVDVFLLSHVVSMFGRSKLAQVVCNANLHSWLGHLPKRLGRIEKICAEKRRWWRSYELSSCLALISRCPKTVQGGWTWHFKSRGTDQSHKYAILFNARGKKLKLHVSRHETSWDMAWFEAQNNRTNEVASNKVAPADSEHGQPRRGPDEKPIMQGAKTTALDGVQRQAGRRSAAMCYSLYV